jgi:hypothetical protein
MLQVWWQIPEKNKEKIISPTNKKKDFLHIYNIKCVVTFVTQYI